MSAALIVGGLLAACGIVALLVMESKVIGMIASGLGAMFIALSFYGDMSASKDAATSDFNAEKAEFNRDFAKATGADKHTVKALSDRAEALRAESDEAEAKRKKTVVDGEKTRKPLMDALTRQVNESTKQETPKDASMSN